MPRLSPKGPRRSQLGAESYKKLEGLHKRTVKSLHSLIGALVHHGGTASRAQLVKTLKASPKSLTMRLTKGLKLGVFKNPSRGVYSVL